MADLADVEKALVALLSGALYPHGTAALAANGSLTRVYRGWPEAAALDADLRAGYVNVSVFPDAGGKNTTRDFKQWLKLARIVPTLSATVVGDTVTFAGTANPGQLAGVSANGKTYVHMTQSGDSPALVAADLAAAMRPSFIVLLSGASIIVPGAVKLMARVVAEQPALQQTRRQEQPVRITCWCPNPETRDATAEVIDSALAQVNFIALPDGSCGRLRYRSGAVIDRAEDASLYRRDLLYTVEYPTTLRALLPEMLFGDLTLVTAKHVIARVIA